MTTTLKTWTILSALLPLLAYGQPPEEVQPSTETTPAEELSAPAPAPAPVAEPRAMPAPAAAPEDKTVRGVQISPGVGIYPIGYDRVNIGDGGTPDGGRWFFDLKPNIGLSSAFKTSTGKTVNLDVAYSLDWREYFNKDVTDRDFTHDLNGEVDVAWTPRLNTHLHAFFEYFYKAGEDPNQDNILYVETEPDLWIKANDQLKFKVGYFMYFVDILDWKVSADGINQSSDAPSDLDEFRRGSFASDATGFNNFDPTSYGLIPTYGSATQAGIPGEQSVWINWHSAVLGLNYVPLDGTTVKFDYRFIFAGFSNVDSQEYLGHMIIPSLSQQLPWKGGSIAVKDELRLRKYNSAVVKGTQDPKQNFRNRFTVALNQGINDYMSFEAFWRMQSVGENKDDYNKITTTHWFYMGMNFGF